MITRNTRLLGSLAVALAAAFGAGSTRAWARPAPAAVAGRPAAPARALLRVELRAGGAAVRELYVGQTVPVTIRAYFLEGTGVSLSAEPRLISDGLTLSDVSDKPAQSSVQLGGVPYTMVTWTGRLTAARAGAARTDIELPVELSYRELPRTITWPSAAQSDQDDSANSGAEDDANDPFSSLLKQTPLAKDPFFSQMFKGGDPFAGMMRDLAGTIRQREVTLRAPGSALQVLELPSPQPAGFTGAVGSFEIAAQLPGGPYRVGEPTTLRLMIAGRGSFSRLALAGLSSTPELTAYPPTAASPPGAEDQQKVFTQTLVPRRPGATTVPPVTLVYFDPHARRYVTRRSGPIHMDVVPAADGAGAGGASEVAAPPGAPGTHTLAAPGGGATQPLPPDVTRPTLTPLIRTDWLPVSGAALALLTGALVLLGRLVRTGTLARWWAARGLHREIAWRERALREAARRGDAAALFDAGRRALQARLGAAWGMPPEAIAAADVGRRLGPRGARVREIFERADRLNYAGAPRPTDPELEQWPERITAELRALETSS